MSVSSVMDTMISQDATASMGVDATPAPMNTAKNVSSIEDVFNAQYDDSGEDDPADNGIELKVEKGGVSKELNKITAKEKPQEEDQTTEEEVAESPEAEAEVSPEPVVMPERVKVKVNGVETEVPLQDVINSYSGQQEIQRRFTEFDKQKKSFEKESTELKQFNDYVKDEVGAIRGSVEAILNEYQKTGLTSKDPLGAFNQLLDKLGVNSNLFEKALFEAKLPEYANYFNMTDIERDAHFTRKENEYLRKKEQGFTERDQQVKLREERQQQDYASIRQAGLDSVKFDELKGELAQAGLENLPTEKVLEYAQQKPTLERVAKIYQEAGVDPRTDHRVEEVKQILFKYPDTTNEEILSYMIPAKVAERTAEVLKQKAPKGNIKNVAPKDMDADLNEMLSFYKQ